MNDELINKLKVVLGTAFSLYFKTHAFHWNVEGEHFPQLHDMLGDQYADIHGSLDELAERIRMLDAYAPATPERLIALSKVRSQQNILPPRDMLLELIVDHETLIAALKDGVEAAQEAKEEGVANYLAERLEAHAKHRWFLRSTAKRVIG